VGTANTLPTLPSIMFGFFKKLVSTAAKQTPAGNLGVDELSRRLGITEQALRAIPIEYRTFEIPKRSGGVRVITAPGAMLKQTQRLILRRVLGKLAAHPAATGFERGHSIVSNALPHVGKEVVIRLDLKDFFSTTPANRVDSYFRTIGWNTDAAGLLTRLCTQGGSLPQGAPTSPRLSNLLNHRLDARLMMLAYSRGLAYSRYADDITLSGAAASAKEKVQTRTNDIIHHVKAIVKDEGYVLHTDKKLRIARKHDRQLVTGLVVNEKVNLPRRKRRWLRAVEHHLKTGKPATLTPLQIAGWRSLQAMIATQSSAASG
jgi:RNA-directed DNA polymerase